MATINGTTFNLKNLSIVSSHRNIVSEQPGSDTNYITDMGYNGLELRLDGYEETEAVYDNVIAEFMKTGGQTLVHRSGWQYTVYSLQLNPILLEGIVDNYFPYDLTLFTSTPYRESTTLTTRPKTITTNNQEWSQDNSANDIDTDGSVNAIPDIQITGGAAAATYDRETGYSSNNTDVTPYTTQSASYVLKKTYTFTAQESLAYTLDLIGMDLKVDGGTDDSEGKATYQAASLNGGAETTIAEYNTASLSYISYTNSDLDIKCAVNENLVVRFYLALEGGTNTAFMKNLDCNVIARRKNVCKNPQVYNITNTTVKNSVANEIEPDMEFRINNDGTGTITYADDFSTSKYLDAFWDKSGITYDDANDEIDFGNSENIIYKIDTKYPITGIPEFTAIIDIDTGTPTIEISSNNITYYNIDTTIVDNVSTVYPLDNNGNLSLKGLNTFYIKIACDGSSTCSLTTFLLSVCIITIDVEHPLITTGGAASTFRCDQHTDSGLNCIVSLIYRHRSWPV